MDSHCLGTEGRPRTHYTPFLCRVNPPMSDNCRAVFIEIHDTALQCAFYLHVVSFGRKLQTFLVCVCNFLLTEVNSLHIPKPSSTTCPKETLHAGCRQLHCRTGDHEDGWSLVWWDEFGYLWLKCIRCLPHSLTLSLSISPSLPLSLSLSLSLSLVRH